MIWFEIARLVDGKGCCRSCICMCRCVGVCICVRVRTLVIFFAALTSDCFLNKGCTMVASLFTFVFMSVTCLHIVVFACRRLCVWSFHVCAACACMCSSFKHLCILSNVCVGSAQR